MPYTVLKVSKVETRVEVEGEFPNEDEANDFVETMERNDLINDSDYMVKSPASRTNQPAREGQRKSL